MSIAGDTQPRVPGSYSRLTFVTGLRRTGIASGTANDQPGIIPTQPTATGQNSVAIGRGTAGNAGIVIGEGSATNQGIIIGAGSITNKSIYIWPGENTIYQNGANVTIVGGQGSTINTNQNGGNVVLIGGQPGNNGIPGSINLITGYTSQRGGDINIIPSENSGNVTSLPSGNVNIRGSTSGSPANTTGTNINITGGQAGVTPGSINLTGGSLTSTSYGPTTGGGSINLVGGRPLTGTGLPVGTLPQGDINIGGTVASENVSAANQTGGRGSNILLRTTAGTTVSATTGNNTGGAGGNLTSTLGAGGAASATSGTGTGAKGGSYSFTAGNGGNGTTTGGAGGDYSITLGNAGTGGNANAGNFTLTGGTATGTGTISRATVTATFVNLTGSSFGRGAPVTISGTTYTVGNFDNWIICNQSGALTITLPTASAWTGRELMFKNISAFSTSSASSNVVPLTGGAATADILGGSSGATTWCTMVSDGTNWIIMQGY